MEHSENEIFEHVKGNINNSKLPYAFQKRIRKQRLDNFDISIIAEALQNKVKGGNVSNVTYILK